MTWNHNNFDLRSWAVQLPVDEDYFDPENGDGDPYDDSAETLYLNRDLGGEVEDIFYYDSDQGAVVLRAPVIGATTPNSLFARAELRQMDGEDNANWALETGGTLSAIMSVNELPRQYNGIAAPIHIAQVLSGSDPILQLDYNDNGEFFVRVFGLVPGVSAPIRFDFENSSGARPSASLEDQFSYVIRISNGNVDIRLFIDEEIYYLVPNSDGPSLASVFSVWEGAYVFFKTGAYGSVTDVEGDYRHGEGVSEVALFSVDVSSGDTEGQGAWLGRPLPVILHGNRGDNQLEGASDNDLLFGGQGNDTLIGFAGSDRLIGQGGRDRLLGGDSNDRLEGGTGRDWLSGNKGADTLDGGDGNDRLKGGGGSDVFVFSRGRDVVRDFGQRDEVDLSEAVGIASLRDLRRRHLIETDEGVEIRDEAGNVMVLLDVDLADLSRGDFLF